MVGVSFQEAAVEVLDILEHTNKKDVKKIPENFINFLKENSSKTYVSELDHSKPIKELKLKPKTEAILGLIYMKYWTDEEGKKNFKEKIKRNQEEFSKEEKIAFDNEVFGVQQNNNEILENNNLPQEYKRTNWFSEMLEKIKKIFRR